MSKLYLLDTNAITHAVRNPTGPVASRIERLSAAVATSVIVESEIRFGIARRPASKIGQRAARYLDSVEILPFDSDASRHYGEIRAHLEAAGQPLDAMDMLIAAHARSASAVLITHNVAHFERVPKLKWEDWQGSH